MLILIGLQEGFKNEILELVKDAEGSSDPRRRPSGTPGWQS